MRGLGRLLALPWLLIALAIQSLAPVEAAAMRADPAGMGICSAAHALGESHRPDPGKDHDHDCCAFACAVAHLGTMPPAGAAQARVAFAAPARLAAVRRAAAPTFLPVARPRARAPPPPVQTI